MCGLFGCMGPGIVNQDLLAIKDLAYISGLRGLDSTGFLQGKLGYGWKNPEFFIEKEAIDVGTFLKWREFQKGNRLLEDNMVDYIAGHVRYATVGKVNDENSHPFEFSNIIGMHNGTLKDSKYLDKDKTDSELFFMEVNERGLSDTLRNLQKDSAYAIVLFNKKSCEFQFARNSKRTLWFMVLKNRRVVYWASEDSFLELIATRHNLQVPEGGIKYAKPDYIYTLFPRDVQTGGQWPKWRGEDLTHTKPANPPSFKEEQKPKASVISLSREKPKSHILSLIKPEGPSVPIINPQNQNKKEITDKRLMKADVLQPCFYCSVELDLVQQCFAKTIPLPQGAGTGFICDSCNKTYEDLQETKTVSIH